MKLLKILPLAFALLLLNTSCKHPVSGPEIIKIDIDDHNRPLLKIAIRDIIPLETSKESMLGYAASVKYFDHRIYVLNNNRF